METRPLSLNPFVQQRTLGHFARYFIILVVLLALPLTASAWSDLRCGNTIDDKWDDGAPAMTANPSNSDNEFTYTLTAPSATDIYFRIRGKIMSGDSYGYLVPDNDGDAVDPSKHYVATTDRTDGNSNDKSFKITGVAKGDEYKITALYTNGGSGSDWYWTLSVEKTKSGSGTGGSSTTIVNKEGLYIYGSMFDTDNLTSNTKLHYKLLKRKGNIYYISVLAADYTFNPEQYSTGSQTDKTISLNGATFKLAYVDAEGNLTTYTPSTEFTLRKNASSPTDVTLAKSGTGDWKIENNGGMYNLVVTTNDDGVPQSWTFESDPLRIVGYKAGSASNWTTNSYMYCTRSSETATYNSNFFGNINYNTGEEFKWILGNMWFGSRKSAYRGDNEENLAWDDDSNSPNMTPVTSVTTNGSGVYFTEFNPSRGDYKIGGNGKPKKVYIIGSAIDSYATDLFTGLDPANATELEWDEESQCYKGEMTFTRNKFFRFLINKDATQALTLADNVGEDTNAPYYTSSVGDDVWDNNKVQYQYYDGTTDNGTNVQFVAPTGVYAIRFYIESSANQSDFNDLSNFSYRYTLNAVTLPYAVVSPSDLVVYYGSTVSPFVSVKYPDESKAGKYVVAYTSDGTDPTYTLSDVTNELPTATGTTKVADLDDQAARYAETATYYLDESGNVLFDDANGKGLTYTGTVTTDADGNKVITPVKAQAFRQYTSGSKMLYKPSGVVAMGSYTLQVRGGLEPGTTSRVTSNGLKLTLSAPTTTQINKWRAVVDVTATASSATASGKASQSFSQPRKGSSDPVTNYLRPTQYDPNTLHADVPVFYTTDGSDPSSTTNNKRHLVTEVVDGKRVITIYQGDTPDNENNAYHGKLRVWLAGGDKPTAGSETDYYKEADYDITYSTSEGGYGQFLTNSTTFLEPDIDSVLTKTNTSGVVDSCAYIYIQPTDATDSIYIYAQEELCTSDGSVTNLALTAPCPGINFSSEAEKTYAYPVDESSMGEPWYLIALPKQSTIYSGYTFRGINLRITSKSHPKPVILRNVGYDLGTSDDVVVFLKYDNATGQVTEVTPSYNNHLKAIDNSYNKPAYPEESSNAFTINLPAAWENVGAYVGEGTTGNLHYIDSFTSLADGTNDYSFSLSSTVEDGTELTIVPWHDNGGSDASSKSISTAHSITINFVNGGYYTYTPSYETSATPTLVYGVKGEKLDYVPNYYVAPTDCINKNHAPKYDKSYLIGTNYWDVEPAEETNDETSDDSDFDDSPVPTIHYGDDASMFWNNKTQKYFLLNESEPTILQPVAHLEPNTSYTVQAIVGQKGSADANVELLLKNIDISALNPDMGDETNESSDPYSLDNPFADVTAIFNSSSKQQLTPTGRIDSYDLGDNAGNGKWRKLEATITTDDNGAILIGLKRNAGEVMITDVTLLENANTDGHVWTKAPSSLWESDSKTGESLVDLSDRDNANSFSFFDRGSNLNSIVLVDKNTVVGGNAYEMNASAANAASPYNVGAKQEDGSYLISDLELTDNGTSKYNPNTFGFKADYSIKASKVAYDRNYSANKRQTFCLPFALTNAQLQELGIENVYTFKGITFNMVDSTYEVTWDKKSVLDGAQTDAGVPYIVEIGASPKNIVIKGDDSPLTIVGGAQRSAGTLEGSSNDLFVGTYTFINVPDNERGKPVYWLYSNGKFMPYSYSDEHKGGNRCKPFRGYFIFDETKMQQVAAKGVSYMDFAIWNGSDGDETTAIVSPSIINNIVSGPIYNLSGQLISRDGSRVNLSKGVYIQNNKKFVVR